MSGICGIHEQGRDFSAGSLAPMFDGLALPGDSRRATVGGRSAILGVAQRWDFQNAAYNDGIAVVADADLVDADALRNSVGMPPGSSTNIADLFSKLYLRHGEGFLPLLHGAFSLALWDERAQCLILAIDKLGIRSLYWSRENSRILFGTRPSAIRLAQEGPASVDPRAVLQYLLFSSVPAPLAIYRGMKRLRPGTFVRFESGHATEKQYWDLQYLEIPRRGVPDWSNAVREEMRSSVHRHLEGCSADSTGCYLSGGTDSSSVVAFASEKHAPTRSFSIAFEEAGFSEIEFARTAANCFQTRHYERWLTPDDAWGALEKLVNYYDEPFANSSAIGAYYCALMAREQGVDVLLAGDGGDEIFAGNERYAHDKYFALYHYLPAWLREWVIEPAVRLLPEDDGALSLPRKYVRRAKIPNPRRILSYGFFLSMPPEQIFETDFLREGCVENWLIIPERHFHTPANTCELNRILYLDVKMTLGDNDLRKVSGTAELAGVSVRYPMLDDRLVDLAGSIPAPLKLRRFEKRYIFKKAMQGILPDKILYKRKHGFGVPLAQWLLREPRMRELLSDVMHDARTHQRGYFRREFFEQLMTLHQQQPNFYGEIVWYLLTLELWHRKHCDCNRDTVHAA